MYYPSYDEIGKYEGKGNVIPISREIMADITTPIILLKKIAKQSQKYFLLESASGDEKWGRYSFLGLNPYMRITLKDDLCRVSIEDELVREEYVKDDAYKILREEIDKFKSVKVDGLPNFTGGFVGYFAYEMIKYAERKLKIKSNDVNDFDLMLFDNVICYDHVKQKMIVISNMKIEEGKFGYDKAVRDIDKIVDLIKDNFDNKELDCIGDNSQNIEFTCNLTKEEYKDVVRKTKEYIYEGDIFQGVLSRKFKAKYKGDLINTYRMLRTTNPSPYMYYLQIDDLQIAGASPETMVRLEGDKLTTFPIAGTRARGKDEEEDLAFERELLNDEKELSEHNMLVDLGRNDIGKISKFGTVKVKDYKKIHRYSRVMHITSAVEGTIRDDLCALDAVKSLLPAGTLSGAPKFRACEIIDSLEKEARGVYGGTIGYIDLSGNLDICIAIRTAVKKGDEITVQAGAGIVYDSIPENEYDECANKAGAVINAVKKASEVID